jgi:hypothetical protein
MMKHHALVTAIIAMGAIGAWQAHVEKPVAAVTTSSAIPKTTATVDYVKGYGITLTKNGKRGKSIQTGTRWTTKKKVYSGGQIYYDLVGGQLANIKYMTITGENSVQTYKGVFHLAYNSAVLRSAAGKYAGRSLKANTNWQVFKQTMVDGKAYLNLGGNNWIKKANGYLKSDKGRGNKTFTASPTPGTVFQANADQTLKTVKPFKSNHYVPNSNKIKQAFMALVAPSRYGVVALPASAKSKNGWWSLADGTDLMQSHRTATAHGYFSSDKEVASSLYKQMMTSGMASDFAYPAKYYRISMTSSGKMNGYSGSIRAKATVDVFNP